MIPVVEHLAVEDLPIPAIAGAVLRCGAASPNRPFIATAKTSAVLVLAVRDDVDVRPPNVKV